MVMNIFKNEEMCEIEDFIQEVNKDYSYRGLQKLLAYVFTSIFIIFMLLYVGTQEELNSVMVIVFVFFYLGKTFFNNDKRVLFHNNNFQAQQLRLYKITMISQLILLSPFSLKNYYKLCFYYHVKFIIWTSLVFFLILGFFVLVGTLHFYLMRLLVYLLMIVLLMLSEILDYILLARAV